MQIAKLGSYKLNVINETSPAVEDIRVTIQCIVFLIRCCLLTPSHLRRFFFFLFLPKDNINEKLNKTMLNVSKKTNDKYYGQYNVQIGCVNSE